MKASHPNTRRAWQAKGHIRVAPFIERRPFYLKVKSGYQELNAFNPILLLATFL